MVTLGTVSSQAVGVWRGVSAVSASECLDVIYQYCWLMSRQEKGGRVMTLMAQVSVTL